MTPPLPQEYKIHFKYPPVDSLTIHLPDEQSVLFDSVESALEVTGQRGPPVSKLMAYFTFVRENPDYADVRYTDICRYAVWKREKDEVPRWALRKDRGARGTHDTKDRYSELVLARMPNIAPCGPQLELFHMRLILNQRAASGYEDLRTFEGVVYPTYRETCLAMGLTVDTHEQDRVMEELTVDAMPWQLRSVFAGLLVFFVPSDPPAFLERHIGVMAQDHMHKAKETVMSARTRNRVLLDLQELLQNHAQNLFMYGIETPVADANEPRVPSVIRQETDDYNQEVMQTSAANMAATLNPEQQAAFDTIMAAVQSGDGGLFSLNACGGSGKTFLLELLLCTLRGEGKVALATAFSGIAASLMTNGRTLHSRCKVPIELDSTSMCNLKASDMHGKLLIRADVLIIDEVTMGSRWNHYFLPFLTCQFNRP